MNKIELIAKIVAGYYKMPLSYLKLKCRDREIVKPRQIAQYFMKIYLQEKGEASLSVISDYFNQNHATIVHSHKTVLDLCQTDKDYQYEVLELNNIIYKKLYEIELKKKQIKQMNIEVIKQTDDSNETVPLDPENDFAIRNFITSIIGDQIKDNYKITIQELNHTA